jgi:hypothetical protein
MSLVSSSQTVNYLIAPHMNQSLEQQMKWIEVAPNKVHI